MRTAFLLSLFAATFAASVLGVPSLGFNSDLSTDEFPDLERTLEMAGSAGFGWARFAFDIREAPVTAGGRDFRRWDSVVDAMQKAGIKGLPILCGPRAFASAGVPSSWRDFVRDTVRHFRGRVTAWEVWNEENIETFWHAPNPTNYLALLKVTAEEIRAVDPNAQVAIGGFSKIPFGYIEKLYRLGAAAHFDVMNVHPYTRPRPPERETIRDLSALRELMSRNGDAEKPIWVTEVGWTVQKTDVFANFAWINGLKVARPEAKSWRAVYAVAAADGTPPEPGLAERIRSALPAGSSVRIGTPSQVNRMLGDKEVDLVIYPFTRDYPADTVEAVIGFVKEGGVLVKAGGYPLHNGCAFRRMSDGSWSEDPDYDAARDRRRLRLSVTGFWNDSALPVTARFFKDDLLEPGDRMIPLVTVLDAQGRPAVSAAVYAFGSDYRGRVIVDGYFGRGYHDDEGNTPVEQARYLVRFMGMAAALGVERSFIYEFRSRENDPYWMENHFGIVGANFRPHTAYVALSEFGQRFGSDSKMDGGPWQAGDVFHPQWTSADGIAQGMMWRMGPPKAYEVRFGSAEVTFANILGKNVSFTSLGGGRFKVRIDGAPLYFSGARLLGVE